MATDVTAITKITHDLLKLQQQHGTGKLTVSPQQTRATLQWNLFFYMGRLVCATGGSHPVRRWYRALQQHCPNLLSKSEFLTAQIDEAPWEVHALNLAMTHGWITLAQAKAVIESTAQETLFEVLGHRELKTEWHPGQSMAQPSVFLSTEQTLQDAQQLREMWRSSELGYLQELLPHFSPDWAPSISNAVELEKRVSASVYQVLIKLMTGKKTLWDVAVQMHRPLSVVMRSLVPLIQQGVLELNEVADLPSPYSKSNRNFRATPKPVIAKKGVIACIDDSAVITQAMEKILQPAGYEVLSILNPLQGISKLLERKPDLIFLDLIMPNTNGYELCTFLRKTSAFQDTPIIILTGHDGMIDRVRAKMAGSSEFLSKPPETEKVLQTVYKYLGSSDAVPEAAPMNLAMS